MDVDAVNIPVVIPAYQREEKLLARYREISGWDNYTSLLISVDGPRNGSSNDEVLRRQQTIKTAENIAMLDNSVNVVVWDRNSGLNDHVFRIFSYMSKFDRIIMIEEDVSVNQLALDFLAENVTIHDSLASAAHVSIQHPHIESTKSRISIFPNQWGISLTSPVMNAYREVHGNRKIDRNVVLKAIRRSLGNHLSRIQVQSLAQWWYNHFFFCEKHGNWADALIQYSVYVNHSFYRVPASSLILDDNIENDFRSMNPRAGSLPVTLCESAVESNGCNDYTCITCEVKSSRIHEASFRNLIGATKHRRLLQFGQKMS